MAEDYDLGLKTITDGKVPETRMANAQATQDFVRQLIKEDTSRSKVRASVDGLVDGNAPYNSRKLAEAGRREACNVNWGTGRSYLESGSGAFYDLFSESPGFVTIETGHGREDQRLEWSRTMSAEADKVFMDAAGFDSEMQLSQNEMVLHGNGPLLFEDEFKVFPRSIETGDMLVPERTRSNMDKWEACAVLVNYYPPELYEFIQNPTAATTVGWNVGYAKLCIQNAMDLRAPDGTRSNNWEFYQQDLKNKSFDSYNNVKVIKTAHLFFKEFSGLITHTIVQRESTGDQPTQYLFKKVGRYENFGQAVHAMYCDRGRGGYHHSVTGLGVKLFGPMAYENRLLCNLMDKAFAPKIFFKPTSAEATQKFQLATFGDYGLLPAGTDFIQNPIQGFLNDGLGMFRTSSELMRSNLSSYRQPVAQEKPGNPETAFKEKMDASQQSALSNTTFSQYYRQLDSLYAEIVRRLCNLNTTDRRAIAFQKACMAEGVARECFGRIQQVKAVRVIGQGSPFMRQQVTSELMPIMGRWSEDGQNNLMNDYIASRAGQSAVKRYNPKPLARKMATDQRERAVNQVAGMKIGVPATVTASQDALQFASTFLQACVHAVQSVKQGAALPEVIQFLDLAAPATAAHIQRLAKDPLRKEVVKEFEAQFKQLASVTDKLKGMAKQQAEHQKAQNGKTQGALTDDQIKALKLHGEETRKNAKLKFQMQRDSAKHRLALQTQSATTRQNLALNDARAISEIRLNHLRAFQE